MITMEINVMKMQNKIKFQPRQLAALTGGILLGITVALPAIASTVTSVATETVIGHIPVLADNGVITATDTDTSGPAGKSDGLLGPGDTLTATGFDFSDADHDPQTSTTYEWLADGSPIQAATGATYILRDEDMGKTITVKATPNTDPTTTEPATGVAVNAKKYLDLAGKDSSSGLTPVSSVVNSVTIEGASNANKPLVGDTLTVVVTCRGADCDSSKLRYQWQLEDTAGSGTYADIVGATSDTYTVLRTDQKRKIQVLVTDK
jgi:hypothetical protein